MAKNRSGKIATSFRLSKKTVEKIELKSAELDISKCDYIESLMVDISDLEQAKAILLRLQKTHEFTIVRQWAWQCLEDLKKN